MNTQTHLKVDEFFATYTGKKCTYVQSKSDIFCNRDINSIKNFNNARCDSCSKKLGSGNNIMRNYLLQKAKDTNLNIEDEKIDIDELIKILKTKTVEYSNTQSIYEDILTLIIFNLTYPSIHLIDGYSYLDIKQKIQYKTNGVIIDSSLNKSIKIEDLNNILSEMESAEENKVFRLISEKSFNGQYDTTEIVIPFDRCSLALILRRMLIIQFLNEITKNTS